MVIHDYLTTISCDKCSKELQIERNIGEKKMRSIAKKNGWKFKGEDDICPDCAKRMVNHE